MIYDPGAAFTVIGQTLWKQIGKPKIKITPDLIAHTNVKIKKNIMNNASNSSWFICPYHQFYNDFFKNYIRV